MESALADLRLEDEEETGETVAWEMAQESEVHNKQSYFLLVDCFLTTTIVNFQSMRSVMVNLWHPTGGVMITNIGEKRFLFRFYCEVDWDKVINGIS